MRGTVFKRKGRKTWSVIVDLDRDQSGKRKQEWHNGYRTKREAERALTEIMGRIDRSEHVSPSRLTVERFLCDEWLPSVKTTVRPSTFAVYQAIITVTCSPTSATGRSKSSSPPTSALSTRN